MCKAPALTVLEFITCKLLKCSQQPSPYLNVYWFVPLAPNVYFLVIVVTPNPH
jgi:hypothetical protein